LLQTESEEKAEPQPQLETEKDDLLALKNDIQKQLEEKLGLSTVADFDESKSSQSSCESTDANESKESHEEKKAKKKSHVSATSSTASSHVSEDTDSSNCQSNHGSPKVKCKIL
jgi:hypothetical protein